MFDPIPLADDATRGPSAGAGSVVTRRSPRRWGIGLLVALALMAMVALAVHANRSNPKFTPEQIDATLGEAQQLMQAYALEGEAIDWQPVRWHARHTAMRTQRLADLELALAWMVHPLRERDGHSHYLPLAMATQRQLSTPERSQPVLLRGSDVGAFPLLQVPGYSGMNEAVWQADGEKGATLLASLLSERPCGLLLDLRGNEGGNMNPMFQALAALLPAGELGYFEDRLQQRIPFPLPARTAPPAQVAVAVLLGPKTGSSGELLAIGLRSLPHGRSFGAPTYGVATAVRHMPLPHGGMLGITTERTLDYQGRQVHGRIAPDVPSDDPEAAASDWLRQQCPS
jgi:carboxyl-terminal processing protease